MRPCSPPPADLPRTWGWATSAEEVGSIAFPIAHIGGIVYLIAAVMADVPVLMVPKVAADDLPRLLTEHRVSVAGASPVFYQMLLSAQLGAGTRDC